MREGGGTLGRMPAVRAALRASTALIAVRSSRLCSDAWREHLKDSALPDGDLILAHVVRVDVQADHLVIELRASKQGQPPGGENGTFEWRERPKSLKNLADRPAAAPLVADDILEFHAGRLLLLKPLREQIARTFRER